MKTKLYLVLLACTSILSAQDNSILRQLKDEERNAVAAIALYPLEERRAILEAASHPEILVRMQASRENTEDQFRNLLITLSEKEQRDLFNLSRYPELLEKLVSGKEKKSRKEMEALLEEYPEEVREQAKAAYKSNYTTLISINDIYNASEMAFEGILSNYRPSVGESYRTLLKLPEVINVLTENISTTVLLGDLYKRQPEQLLRELDSLNIVVAEEKARELNEWKKSLEENPEALAEYEQAADEFAREQGYDQSDYSEPMPQQYTTDVYVHYIWRPYPYWFGWPWWYSCECWYPYPWWYHWGYYYGPGNVVVFVGLPSTYFVHWHFQHHTHFYHYPHFTNQMVRYYSRNPHSTTSVTTVVRQWKETTRKDVAANWLESDENRVERIREYGQLNMDYEAEAQQAGANITTREYLRNNSEKYPALTPASRETEATAPKPQQGETREKIPVRNYPTPSQPQKPREIETQPSKRQEIDRAKTYHENKWEKPKTHPQRSDAPKQAVPPAQEPQPSAPQRTVPQERSEKPKKF